MTLDTSAPVLEARPRQASGFTYVLGMPSAGGYGAGPHAREAMLGTAFHRDTAAFIRQRMPGGFMRLAAWPTRRFAHKVLHFLFARHATTRIRNTLTYLRQRQRRATVDYMPPAVFMDATSKCSLRCPGCSTGLGVARKRTRAPLERMQDVVRQVAPTAGQIAFYHLGEAFFNDDVFEAIAYARANGLWTMVTSHLSLDREDLARRIVDSGLHELLVSCDGATQAVYGHYRRGGDVERVWSNLRAIRDARDRLGRRTPHLRVKMLVFEHNWHEARAFERRAREAGADEVQFVAGNGDESFATGVLASGTLFDVADLAWKVKLPVGRCEQVWQDMYITPDGGLFSCCLGHRDSDLFALPGETLELARLWNAPGYVATRRFFLGEIPAAGAPANCRECLYVKEYDRARTAPSQP